MPGYLSLYILINLFCAAQVLIFAVHSRFGMGATVSQRRFVVSMIVLAIFFTSDTVWYAMDCGALPQIWSVSMGFKSVYFLSATLAGYVWFLYMGLLTKLKQLKSPTFIRLTAIPVVVHAFLCIINIPTSILFGITSDFSYFRGPIFGIQYLFTYLYLIFASAHSLYKASCPENVIDRSRYIIIATFPILPAISGILQLFWWRIPFNCMAFTLAVVIVYLTELSQQISQEPLTKLANRKQFMRVLEANMQNYKGDDQLVLFMMDIDRFKQINDTYGHVEGDNAILAVSSALKSAVSGLHKRAILARYGGDEFAIIAHFDTADEISEFKGTINREVKKQCEGAQKPYQLALSVGFATYQESMRTIRGFINAADERLYKEKEALRHAR
ncbi:MAG: diguanylate cyclase [Atopobiaceae bacterium]|nr:diguanylate cyclase [Atopobiaceae bacterium]